MKKVHRNKNLLCHFQSISQHRLSQNVQVQVGIPPPNLEPFLRAASLIEKSVSQAAAPSWLLCLHPKSCNHASLHLERERMVGWLLGELCVTKVVSSSSVLDIVSKLPVGSGTSAKSVMKSLGGAEEVGLARTGSNMSCPPSSKLEARSSNMSCPPSALCSLAASTLIPVSPPAALL